MTLTAREAMQALLDGKTLRKGEVTIIPTEWGFQMQADDGSYKDIILRDCEVVEEYPLTYEQALRAMLDGKVVMNTESEFKIRLSKETSCFEVEEWGRWEPDAITIDEMQSLWKVVE